MAPPREAVGSSRGLPSPGSLERWVGSTEVPVCGGYGPWRRLRKGRIHQLRSGKGKKAIGFQAGGALRILVGVCGPVVRLGARAQPLLCRDIRASPDSELCMLPRAQTSRTPRVRLPL